MPSAPWAKLKTPDVEYVTTSPLAAMAKTAPVIRPLISRFIRVLDMPPELGRGPLLRGEGTELRRDALGVELGRGNGCGLEALDDVIIVAVEEFVGAGHDLDPLRAVELHQHPAFRRG